MEDIKLVLSERIYNTCVVLDTFCKSKNEYEEIQNISPIVQFIKEASDKLCLELSEWDK